MRLDELIAASSNKLLHAQVSFGHGTQNAHDEASWLVLWSLGLPLDLDVGEYCWPLSADDVARADALIDRRIKERVPSAYLTGEAWLQGVPFFVDARCIVPRSLIAECLVNESIDPWLSAQCYKVLDLCTGNASLAIICAMIYPQTQVDALDISPQALEVAALNVERHDLRGRVRLVMSDALESAIAPYDLILCNPPYVNSQSMQALPPEFKAEPNLALAGGEDGMDFIRRLLSNVHSYMTPLGVLVLEVGHERTHFERAFPALDAVWLQTSAGEDQVALITAQALQKTM